MEARTLRLHRPALDEAQLGFFRYGDVGERVVLTNDAGEWELLSRPDFAAFLEGRLPTDHPQRAALQQKAFLRDGLDAEALALRLARKKRWLGQGPHLHVLVTTLRCNQSCQYCHASRTDMHRVDTDMSMATARQAVDFALSSPSPYINFEFQGGEPTVNWPVVEFVVEYARERNRTEGRQLDFSLVTNLTTMTAERADWLIDHGVLLCTSLDGPREVHDGNRPLTGQKNAAFDLVTGWMRDINARYVARGLDPELWHVDALMTTTRRTLPLWKEVVDTYVGLGLRNVHLRPLNPFGFAPKTWGVVGYTMAEFMAFYEQALDYIIALNRAGVQVIEGTAAVFLSKMLTPDDPNFVDLRSPHGAGIGQIAYHYDGAIYPHDEGRMMAGMGDQSLRVGTLGRDRWEDVVRHPTLRALALASTLDALPGCSTCWNAPWCGVRPEHDLMLTGALFAPRYATPKCQQHMTIASLLLDRLAKDTDGSLERMFRRWTVQRPRETAPAAAISS